MKRVKRFAVQAIGFVYWIQWLITKNSTDRYFEKVGKLNRIYLENL